jgi:hypothetical protein
LEATGTSFSAPVVTHALAGLTARLPRVNSGVLRAFAVHFAERHRAYRARRDEFGFGRLPLSFADAMDCTPDHVHVLFVDQIARGDILGYQLPLPQSFSGAAKMSVTLAYASPVRYGTAAPLATTGPAASPRTPQARRTFERSGPLCGRSPRSEHACINRARLAARSISLSANIF